MRGRRVGFLVTCLILSTLSSVMVSSQQIFPSVDLQCLENEVMFDLPDYETVIVHCSLENTNAYSEEVEVSYDSGVIETAGPSSVTLGAGEEVDFEVVLRAGNSVIAGNHGVNISAKVTQAGGVPVGILTGSETHGLNADVPAWKTCNANYGKSSITVEAGEDISFTSSYSCDSNLNQTVSVELHLVSENSDGEGMWPSGFNEISEDVCLLEIDGGNGMGNCQFKMTTPSNLVDDWKGCLVILYSEIFSAKSCQEEVSLGLTVSAKKSETTNIGFGENGTFFEDLGISEEDEVVVLVASTGLVVFLAIIVIIIRRRQ